MTELVPYASERRALANYSADWLLDPAEIAQRIGGTDFVPTGLRGNAAAITAALLYGAEVGLGRMQSLAKIAVINGRPTLAAEAQRALILAAGHDLWIEESNTTRCTVCGRRRGSDAVSRVTWTMDDAKRAGLASKGPWRAYPRQMLLARASAELARAVFPDAIGGLAATEELDEDGTLAGVGNGDEASAQAPSRPSTRRRRASVTTTTESPPAAPAEPAVAASSEPEPGESTEPPEAPEPELMTDAQRRRMMAAFRDVGISDRGERLTYSAGVVGREVASAAELTVAEASQIIDTLADQAALRAAAAADEPASPFQPPADIAAQLTGALPADEQAVLDELAEVAEEIPPGSSV